MYVKKRILWLTAILLVLTLVLCACIGVKNTAGSTTDAQTDNTTLSTEGQEGAAVLDTAEDFQEFIKNNRWYTRALGCVFEKPEDIPAWFYFYNGVGENGQLTAEEGTFLANKYKEKNPSGNYDVVSDIKLPVAKINEALSILGVTVADIQIPDRWVYYDETDSYYFWVSDAYGITDWSVTKVEKGPEETVAVYWETDDYYWGDPTYENATKGAKMVLTMQQQPDGTYHILSNVPQQ